jgi:hypothetical protein
MIALALPTKIHAFVTLLAEGALLFLVLLIGAVVPWIGKPISTRRYIAICGFFTALWIVVAAIFVIRG